MLSARVLAFAAFEPALWGVVWAPYGSAPTLLAIRAGAATGLLPVDLGEADSAGPWSVEAEEVSLAITPTAALRPGRDPAGRLAIDGSLCTATGRVVLDGAGHDVGVPAWRSGVEAELGHEDVDSFRHVVGWTPAGDLVAAASLRPRKARGHEGDLAAATVLGSAEGLAVVEARLSTTYTASGAPRSTGLELWFEESADESGDGAAHYPGRAAGEAVGAPISWEASGFALQAVLLRWHTRGEQGSGVYLVGRRP